MEQKSKRILGLCAGYLDGININAGRATQTTIDDSAFVRNQPTKAANKPQRSAYLFCAHRTEPGDILRTNPI